MSDCVFCKIVKEEIPAKIIARNELAIAFLDVNPVANGHSLVIPKQHARDWSSTPADAIAAIGQLASEVAKKLRHSKLEPWGINYLSNEGNVAGQEVFHTHLHVIPKYAKGEGFGFKTNKVNILSLETIIEKLNLN